MIQPFINRLPKPQSNGYNFNINEYSPLKSLFYAIHQTYYIIKLNFVKKEELFKPVREKYEWNF